MVAKRFEGTSVDVEWDGRLCIHMGECGRADNDLFVAGRKPWCQPDLVQIRDVTEVVERCPTGALTYSRKDGNAEKAAPENTLFVCSNGPLYVRGELAIEGAAEDAPGLAFRAALCRCGQSKNKPFCDNSHESAAFVDHGAVGPSGEGISSVGGPLRISPSKNGPLLVAGNLTIRTPTGRVGWRGRKCALCRCGGSKNKPFCDGSHKLNGFEG
jgi:CDGSH-type Zn-finger protein/uncharacterized Fe-S cluster protein YjdI